MCKKSLLIFLYSLCLLFCSISFAELSDEEKRAFIEGLARPFPEKRVFYRWQSETSRRTLMREKELTEERFKYFMNIRERMMAGPGLYAADDLHSSKMFGDTIMQIEVGTKMKYIDLTDSDTLKKLEKKGITERDVYQLKPKAAVKYYSQYWVFKAREGLRFQAFSSKGIPWNELNGSALDKPFFREAIKDDVKNRIKAKGLLIHSAEEGIGILSVARNYLKPEEKKQIVNKTIPLIKSAEEGRDILSVAGNYLEPKEIKQIANKTIPLIKSVWEGKQVLHVAREYLEPEEKKQIARKMVPLISSAREGRYILSVAREYLEPEEKKQIVHRILEFTGGRKLVEYVKEEGLLTDEEYKEALATFENGGQKAQHRPTLNSGTKAERLKCLKKQLQISSE